jgi:hypothetical protein
VPGHVLGAAERACEPRTRAASVPGRQPPVRRRGRGASPGAGRGHQPPNPAARGPSWTPRTTPSPTQLLTEPRGRTAANTAASGPSDRAAGPPWSCFYIAIVRAMACVSGVCGVRGCLLALCAVRHTAYPSLSPVFVGCSLLGRERARSGYISGCRMRKATGRCRLSRCAMQLLFELLGVWCLMD